MQWSKSKLKWNSEYFPDNKYTIARKRKKERKAHSQLFFTVMASNICWACITFFFSYFLILCSSRRDVTWCDMMWRDVTSHTLVWCFSAFAHYVALSRICQWFWWDHFIYLFSGFRFGWMPNFFFFIWIKKIKRVVFSSSSWSDVYFTTFIYFLYLPWWPFFVYRYWTKNQHTKFVSIFRDLLWVKKFEKFFVLNVLKKSDNDS